MQSGSDQVPQKRLRRQRLAQLKEELLRQGSFHPRPPELPDFDEFSILQPPSKRFQGAGTGSGSGIAVVDLLVEGTPLQLPASIFPLDSLKDVLSMETWHTCLDDRERASLMRLLPGGTPADSEALSLFLPEPPDLNKVVRDVVAPLFGGENFHFGNPVETLWRKIKDGLYDCRVVHHRAKVQKLMRRQHLQRVMEYHSHFLERVILRTQDMVLGVARHFGAGAAAGGLARGLALSPGGTSTSMLIDSDGSRSAGKSASRSLSRHSPEPQPIVFEQLSVFERSHMPAVLIPAIHSMFLQAPNRVLAIDDMIKKLQKNTAVIALFPPESYVDDIVFGTLHFLACPPNLVPISVTQPSIPVDPFVTSLNEGGTSWQWIADSVDHATIVYLEALFVESYPHVGLPPTDSYASNMAVCATKTQLTIKPSTPEATRQYRIQERHRYLCPDRPWTFRWGNQQQTIIAPMRRGPGFPLTSGRPRPGQQPTRAREHFLLKNDRPAHITVLSLVRDAASRLPNGIGTRADVCELLRDSQFVVESVTDSQINQVVSGALDRLHYESDPCVKFDMDKKQWVYLHRERSEEEFVDPEYSTRSTKPSRVRHRHTHAPRASAQSDCQDTSADEQRNSTSATSTTATTNNNNIIIMNDSAPPTPLPTTPTHSHNQMMYVQPPNSTYGGGPGGETLSPTSYHAMLTGAPSPSLHPTALLPQVLANASHGSNLLEGGNGFQTLPFPMTPFSPFGNAPPFA